MTNLPTLRIESSLGEVNITGTTSGIQEMIKALNRSLYESNKVMVDFNEWQDGDAYTVVIRRDDSA